MTRAERWMSRVLPPRAAWMTALVIVGGTLVACWLHVEAGRRLNFHVRDPYGPFYFAAGVCLFLYGVWRAKFFPANDRSYAAWLATTPWTAGRPLPGGPVGLVAQDALVVGSLAAAMALPDLFGPDSVVMVWGVLAFSAGYLLLLSAANIAIGQGTAAVVTLAALGATPFTIGRTGWEWTAVALAAIGYVSAMWGVRRGLVAFPWDDRPPRATISAALNTGIVPPQVHWSFVEAASPLSWRTVAAIAGLGGWCAFAIVDGCERLAGAPAGAEASIAWINIGAFFAAYMALGRLVVYCMKHHPPISLLGRLATGRLIIPGYDKVLVGPIAAVAVAWALPRVMVTLGTPAAVFVGAAISVALAIVFGMGPSLRDWHLTGEHRLWFIRPAMRAKRKVHLGQNL